jgi:nicotinamidase-related amidase
MSKTLLLIVDVQNAIADQKPYLFGEVLSNIKILLGKFRELKLPYIFIQHDDGIGSDLEKNTYGWEIVKEIAPLESDKVIPKRYNSAFKETALEKELIDMNIRELIVVGLQTEFCIDTTIRVAFEKGYKVIIPEKTNTTIDGKILSAKDIFEHHHTIFNNRFGTIVKMEELIASITK